jgi:hypothetical protein
VSAEVGSGQHRRSGWGAKDGSFQPVQRQHQLSSGELVMFRAG